MNQNVQSHLKSVLQALLVTFLWSSSWVLIKFGLQDIPALTFAGLRYMLAFLCLLPFVLRKDRIASLRALTARGWSMLFALGIILYAVTQGAQFLGLVYLPAVTVSLLLSFSPVMVALMAMPLLGERSTFRQWMGVFIFLFGAFVYFYPVEFPNHEILGLIIVVVGVLANSGSALLGRQVNRQQHVDPLTVTTVSMGIGAALLLIAGLSVQGMPALNLSHWANIIWLAVVNTAFAFTLWNHTLRTLSAMESSIINNTMLIQIAVLAWIFLGEILSIREIMGLAFAGIGALIVQLRRS